MKTLLILRHGKAQPDAPDGDRARELTERGQRASALMGDYIRSTIGVPDAILTSDATRAQQTAEIAAEAIGFSGELTLVPQIYAADLRTLQAVVRSIIDEVDLALLTGHNPGLEELAASLAGIDEDDVRLPTAGVAHLEFDVDKWDLARKGTARWRGIATPKTVTADIEGDGVIG
jgi:phosphohistidine phosphatase